MAGQNPYDNYLSKEQVMQSEISRLLSLKFPDLFWWHTVNEGRRTPYEQYLFKKMGGLKGVADFVILEEGVLSKGLVVEIKWGKNSCTRDQVDFLLRASKKGFTAAVVYDHAKDFLDLIEQHLKTGLIIPSDGILLVKNGKRTVVSFDDAYSKLCRKNTEKQESGKAKELFLANAVKKFGKPVKSKLFNL